MTLNVEPLPDRLLPSVSLLKDTITVIGTNAADRVNVNYVLDSKAPEGYVIEVVQADGDGNTVTVGRFNPITTTRIRANLLGGDDNYFNATYLDDRVYGGDGNDHLVGGYGNGAIWGEAGDDYLESGDRFVSHNAFALDGGPGADTIKCCFGPDRVVFDPTDTLIAFDPAEDRFAVKLRRV